MEQNGNQGSKSPKFMLKRQAKKIASQIFTDVFWKSEINFTHNAVYFQGGWLVGTPPLSCFQDIFLGSKYAYSVSGSYLKKFL